MRTVKVTRRLKEAAVAFAAGSQPSEVTRNLLVMGGLAEFDSGRKHGTPPAIRLTAAGNRVVAQYRAAQASEGE